MLRLSPDHERDTVWDALLPVGVTLLPPDLAAVDELLSDPSLLAPFRTLWRERDAASGRCAEAFGRPTIAMATYVRLMVIKARTGWGYVTLVREVSDSLHLRRFCLIPLSDPVPTESTVRKLTRRLGPELVAQLIREVIELAARERRFVPRALRIDSTVVEADIRYPTDSGLAAAGVRLLAGAARHLTQVAGEELGHVADRSRAVGRCLRALGRTLRRRTGEAHDEVLRLTGEAGDLLARSIGEARRMLKGVASETEPGIRAARERLGRLVDLAAKVVEQIGRRMRGEPIADRLVSFADPDARPIRKGKLANPTQFGYLSQIAEVTGSTGRGARGLVLPPPTRAGSIHENALLPATIAELGRCGLRPREVAVDAGFGIRATREAFAEFGATVHVVGSATNAGSRRTRRRLACYRVGAEGRISHLKRAYGARWSRLRGTTGAAIWTNWAILAYDLDTAAALPTRRPNSARATGRAA
jgi:transposase, IS5 family